MLEWKVRVAGGPQKIQLSLSLSFHKMDRDIVMKTFWLRMVSGKGRLKQTGSGVASA